MVSWLFWPIVIGLIIYLFTRKKKQTSGTGSVSQTSGASAHSLEFADSKEDMVSQGFFLLAFSFFGISFFALNRDLGDPLPWHVIVCISSLIGLYGAYALQSVLILPFAIGGLVSWWVYQISGVAAKGSAYFAVLAMLPVLFYVLGHFHARQPKYAKMAFLYRGVGILFITLILFGLSTQSGVQILQAVTAGKWIFSSWQIVLSLGGVTIPTLLLGRYSLAKQTLSIYEYFAVILVTCLFVGISLLPEQFVYTQSATNLVNVERGITLTNQTNLSPLGIFWVILFNILIFFELLGLIFSGYARHEEWLINLGALCLFLLIIAKYFDWFFTFMDKSLFFLVAGILLFALGWSMERGRRYMIATVKGDATKTL